MAPRFSRRRDHAAEPPTAAADDDESDLGAEEHAWWAQRDIDEPWAPHERAKAQEEAPERDVLAEHFGSDWRTSFGFDHADAAPREEPPEEPAPEEPTPAIDTSDPYAVLEVDPAATWEDIVEAHRAQARRHHPDRLFGRPETEVAAAEVRIRDINAAYQELRVRRGR